MNTDNNVLIVSRIYREVNPIGIDDLPDDEYTMEADMLLSKPGPYSGTDVFAGFDALYNVLVDPETDNEYFAADPIMTYDEWCEQAAIKINAALGFVPSI